MEPMGLEHYEGYSTAEDAVLAAGMFGIPHAAVVAVRYLDQFYAVATDGNDKHIAIGSEIVFRTDDSGTWTCRPTSESVEWPPILQRRPRYYADIIFNELKRKDPDVALFTVTPKGVRAEVSAEDFINYPVILGLTFKQVLVPVDQLPTWGQEYFKEPIYLTEPHRLFSGTPYQKINPFLCVAYNPSDSDDMVLYGFTHLRRVLGSKLSGIRVATRRPTDYEKRLLASLIQ